MFGSTGVSSKPYDFKDFTGFKVSTKHLRAKQISSLPAVMYNDATSWKSSISNTATGTLRKSSVANDTNTMFGKSSVPSYTTSTCNATATCTMVESPTQMDIFPTRMTYKEAVMQATDGKIELLTPEDYMDRLEVRVQLLFIDYWLLIGY